MKRFNIQTLAFTTALALSLGLFLGGCGSTSSSTPASSVAANAANSTTSSTGTNTSTSSIFNIVSVSPAAGTYSSIPASLQVTFSESNINSASVNTASNYYMICGASYYAATSVTVSGSTATINFSLPSLQNGTACIAAASADLQDTNGVGISGSLSVSYTLSTTNTNTSSGNTTTIASIDATPMSLTSVAGGNGGNGFTDIAPTAYALGGLYVNYGTASGQYVDGIEAAWYDDFSNGNISYGTWHGSQVGSTVLLECEPNQSVIGVYGNAGAFVDSLGLICQSSDLTVTTTSSTYGGPGGSSFQLLCPAGEFVTSITGGSGGYLDRIQLGCQ